VLGSRVPEVPERPEQKQTKCWHPSWILKTNFKGASSGTTLGAICHHQRAPSNSCHFTAKWPQQSGYPGELGCLETQGTLSLSCLQVPLSLPLTTVLPYLVSAVSHFGVHFSNHDRQPGTLKRRLTEIIHTFWWVLPFVVQWRVTSANLWVLFSSFIKWD
jgi:hypothetical protein